MFSMLSSLLNYFFINFYVQVSPGYDAASKYLSTKTIHGKDFLVFVVFGIIAVVFIIFIFFTYIKEKKRPRY